MTRSEHASSRSQFTVPEAAAMGHDGILHRDKGFCETGQGSSGEQERGDVPEGMDKRP